MADSKISQLTPITGANLLDSDEFIVARAGTFENFAVTRAEMFQSTPAIATSELTTDTATVQGNITVTGTVDGRDVAADGSKLDGIESNATADQTAGEIKTAYESNADTNAFTDAEQSKLTGIEAGATADQTAGEIKTAYESNADTNAFTDAEQSKLSGIESGAEVNTVDSVNTQTGTVVLDADDIDDSTTPLRRIRANSTVLKPTQT